MSIIEHTYETMILERNIINDKDTPQKFELLRNKINNEINFALENNQSIETTVNKIKRQLLYFESFTPVH